MGLRRFDRKFGVDLLGRLPEAPAVYLFRDEQGAVLYVGKAKNVRRRLSQYRNASRRKAHRKMRELVRVAHSLEVRPCESETVALLRENELIRELRPEYNVDGAYEFLYPAIGTGGRDGQVWLCIASQIDAYGHLDLRWHGCFRPRWRAREAFDALVSLCGRIGHLEPRSRLPELPTDVKGTRFVAVRRMGDGWTRPIRDFFDGESDALLARLFDALLEQRGARLDRADVQASIEVLKAFHVEDARRLREARTRVGWPGSFVPQAERDALFIGARSERSRAPSLGAGPPDGDYAGT
jgi:predicted GIY-YIG superfamily endonuclease